MAQASRAEYVAYSDRLVLLFKAGQSLVDDSCGNARRTNKMIKSLEETMDVFLSKKEAFIEKGQFAEPEDQTQVRAYSETQYAKYEKLCADLELLEPDPDRPMSKEARAENIQGEQAGLKIGIAAAMEDLERAISDPSIVTTVQWITAVESFLKDINQDMEQLGNLYDEHMLLEGERTQTITQAKYEALNPFKRHMITIKIALAARQPTDGPQGQNAARATSVACGLRIQWQLQGNFWGLREV